MMKPYPTTDCPARSSAFTLIELLVVITLIAMLGSMSIAVSRVAIESAKKSRTEMTIAKIDAALTTMYEKYADKKVDVSPYLSRSFSNTGKLWFYDNCAYPNNDLWKYYGTNSTAQFYMSDTSKWSGTAGQVYLRNNHFLVPALWRLHLIRDMMRMDMPCWATEIYWGPVLPDGSLDSRTGRTTPLSVIYQGALSTATGNNWDAIFSWSDAQHAQFNAELLFLVVMNGDPETRQLFNDREVADVNNNGLFEFVDGWGRPIYWLRWAPGIGSTDRPFFNAILSNGSVSAAIKTDLRTALLTSAINTDTDRQYSGNEVYTGAYACRPGNDPVFGYVNQVTAIETALNQVDPVRVDDDPLDPLGMDCLCPILSNNRLNSRSWLLVPYVFSCGVDGMAGINSGNFRCNNVGQMPEFMRTVLYPFQYNLNCGKYEVDSNGVLTNYQKDNIHNHKITR
ncbi:MAG: type II secretion system protein [Thermoguttaceae bacterium]|nr:type II secretion system protein [Thermoguttaceae bacterium]